MIVLSRYWTPVKLHSILGFGDMLENPSMSTLILDNPYDHNALKLEKNWVFGNFLKLGSPYLFDTDYFQLFNHYSDQTETIITRKINKIMNDIFQKTLNYTTMNKK